MDVLQTWIIVGIPGLIVTAALLVGRSQLRAIAGYVVLFALTATFLLVPEDIYSAAAVGLIGFLLVAMGRGMQPDQAPEHHENRRRFTTAQHD